MQFLLMVPLLLLFLSLGIPYAQADNQVVKVGVYENQPKVFTSEDGRPSGIFIDIIEFIAKREGWDLKYVPGTWAEGLDRLAKGEIDLMPDVAYTSDREKIYSFHKIPVLSVWSQVYARKGSNIQSILDLNGKRIAALENTIQMETFTRLSNSFGLKIILIPVPNYKTEFEMIARGKVDAGVTNRFYGLMHARKFGFEDTPVMFDPAPFFFAAQKNDPKHLLNAIDRHIAVLKKDTHSVYYASLERWTSEEVRYKLPAWLKIFGLSAGIILLVSIIGSIVLKRQVNSRTHELQQINKEMEQRIIERTEKLEQANKKLLLEIEERAKTEKALFTSETMYRNLIESVNSVILRWKPDGSITFFNAYAQKFLGFTEPEIIGRNIMGSIVPVLESSGRDLSWLIEDIVSRPEAHAFNENENIRKNGEKVWIAWTNKPIYNESGSVTEILSVGNDITKRKKIEESLKRTLDDLAIAKERAESADRIKSAFLAAMSHELRTPLNSIIGFTGMVLQGLAGPLNKEQEKQLGMVRGSARHLLDLINDILDISKIEAGQLTIMPEIFDLKKSIEKAVQIIMPLSDKKNLSLHFKIEDDVSEMYGDQRRVEQILINLLSNAVKFTNEGEINLHCHSDNNSIILSVVDTGIGIKPENFNIIFDAFRQVDTGIARVQEGTGLGLNITKKLVEMMGGSIHVESEWEKGSTLTVIFPIKER